MEGLVVQKPHRRSATVTAVVAAVVVLGALLAVYVAGVLTPTRAGVPAFPGAEGFGSSTPGGRGGTVHVVTNLQDSGPGSLREAIEAAGPRIVVFAVSGTIRVSSGLSIDHPYITIAGQSAPGEGILIRPVDGGIPDALLRIKTHDVVLRYLRLRMGRDTSTGKDVITVSPSADDPKAVHDVMLDHLSISWGVDESLSFYDGVANATVQNSIIAESLSFANHTIADTSDCCEEHSKALLVGGYDTRNVSILRNLFASNVDRNPQVSGTSVADVRNNVIYNPGPSRGVIHVDQRGGGEGVTLLSSAKGNARMNWVGNFYRPGPDSDPDRPEFATYAGDSDVTRADPSGDGVADRTQLWYGSDNMRWTSSGDRPARIWSGTWGQVSKPFEVSNTTTLSATEARDWVLAHAGASRFRDAVDTRLVDEYREGAGQFIDDPAEVGGWPAIATDRRRSTDSDADGMPDVWESANGCDVNKRDSSGDADRDGYTNIEEWINALAE